MLIHSVAAAPVDCRSVDVDACEHDVSAAQDAQVEALGCFQLRLRDQVDFSVNFSKWLQQNGNAQLSDAEFVAAVGSPSVPNIVGQAFNASGRCVVVLAAHEGATAGDAYWLDVTATVAAVQATTPQDVPLPARTLVRRIHVVVVNG